MTNPDRVGLTGDEIDEQTAMNIAREFIGNDRIQEISKFRFYILTDQIISTRVKRIEKDDISEKEVSQEEVKKSKKELKREKKEAKRKAKEDKKLAKEAFFQEEIENTQKDISEEIRSIDEDTGVYDIFEDDRKKKKKK